MKPLAGIRILDFTQFTAGPLCTMLLGDLGAEVIKFENPLCGGDPTRKSIALINGMSSSYACKNRAKKSVAINLKDLQNRRRLLELVRSAHILVESFKPGTMEKYGLSYENVHKINPRLIYASISGYGQTGPYSRRPAVDGAIQAESGFMSLTGTEDTFMQAGPPIADCLGGLTCGVGILAALNEARDTGVGRHVDIALLDSILPLYGNIIPEYFITNTVPQRHESQHQKFAPCQVFSFSKNEKVYISITTDEEWRTFTAILERPDWGNDPRFAANQARLKNRGELVKLIQEILQGKDSGTFIQLLRKNQIACAPVNDLKQVANHPQIKARNMIVDVEYPSGAAFSVAGCPIKLTGEDDPVAFEAYPLGYHTHEIMSNSELSDSNNQTSLQKKEENRT